LTPAPATPFAATPTRADVRARRTLVAADRAGVTVARTIRSESPLLLRTRTAPDGSLLATIVGGAGGPLGGDRLELNVEVLAGARLTVRSVAATMAMPGPRGERSRSTVGIKVEDGGRLDWAPEPLLSVAGSDHETLVEIDLAPRAAFRWIERVVLGRSGEPGGILVMRHRLRVGGRTLLDQDVRMGTAAMSGPGGNGPWRVVTTALHTTPDGRVEPRTGVEADCRWGVMPLDDRICLALTLAGSARLCPDHSTPDVL
jgi:urease accessory protein